MQGCLNYNTDMDRELKESLHKLQKQMQFEKEEFAMRLENASTDAKLAVERELTAVKGDFEKTKTELEAVQKQFKVRAFVLHCQQYLDFWQ